MRIIPVLDLKGGEVVRAQQGKRDRYRPIVTPLSQTSDVVAVTEGLRRLYPFPTFYIADLDAIEGGTPNSGALARLKAMAEPPELWVDAGVTDEKTLSAALAESWLCPVVGSESQQDDALLRRFCDHPELILSLDFFEDGFRGGVRNEADIRALSSLGIAAALVATSLHDGTLTPGQLATLGT
ncbi:MAG: nickel transporter [Mesorhizobium sp.]|nr:MAG: nickel transporter [Mesorhizobium sp.]